MKHIKDLKPFFRDLDADIKEQQITNRKEKAFEKWFERNMVTGITGTYSFSAIGSSCIRIFLYLDKNERSTINILKWLSVLKKQGWEVEKFWRKEQGYFAYRAERKYKNQNNYMILVEETANIDGCVITKKRKMQTVYETNCERESVIF